MEHRDHELEKELEQVRKERLATATPRKRPSKVHAVLTLAFQVAALFVIMQGVIILLAAAVFAGISFIAWEWTYPSMDALTFIRFMMVVAFVVTFAILCASFSEIQKDYQRMIGGNY